MPLTLDQLCHDWIGFDCEVDAGTVDKPPRLVTLAYWTHHSPQPGCLTEAELTALDQDLPELAMRYSRSHDPMTACNLLKATLCLWDNPPALVLSGEMHAETSSVNWVTQVNQVDAANAKLRIDRCHIQPQGAAGRPIVTRITTEEITLQRAWLEQHTPGSMHRLRIAAGLALTWPALHAYVFTEPEPTVSMALPDHVSDLMAP